MTALQQLPEFTKMFLKGGYRYRAELPEDEAKKEYEKEQKELQQIAALARQEETRDFSLLHAHTLVSMWGNLEAAIEDMLVGILCNEPETLKHPVFLKLKLSVAEFENLNQDERMRMVLSELVRSRAQGKRLQGVDYFEFILEPFSLSGPVEPDLKKSLRAMHNLRNIIVHRSSIADSRFVENCPWLGIKVGDSVSISSKQMWEFHRALPIYVSIIGRRLGARYGQTVTAPELFL